MPSRAEKRKQLAKEQEELANSENKETVEENPGIKDSSLADQIKAEESTPDTSATKEKESEKASQPAVNDRAEVETKMNSTLPGETVKSTVDMSNINRGVEQVAAKAEELVQQQEIAAGHEKVQAIASFGEQQVPVENAYSSLDETQIKEQWIDFLGFLGDSEVQRIFTSVNWQHQLRSAINRTNFL